MTKVFCSIALGFGLILSPGAQAQEKEKKEPEKKKVEKKMTAKQLLEKIEKLEGGKDAITEKELEAILALGAPDSAAVTAALLVEHAAGDYVHHANFDVGLGPVVPLNGGVYAAKDGTGSIAAKPQGKVRCLFIGFTADDTVVVYWLKPNLLPNGKPVLDGHVQFMSGRKGFYVPRDVVVPKKD